jgi:hypothetical protein
MLHRFTDLWDPVPTAIVALMTLITLGVGEVTARHVGMGHHTDADPADPDEPYHRLAATHVRHLALPNYWMEYTPEDIYAALHAQQDTMLEFVVHTAYNAGVLAGIFSVLLLFVTMTLGVRALSPKGLALRVIWLLPLAAFVLDFAEDMALLIVAIDYPVRMDWLAQIAADAAFAKFMVWAALSVVWTLLVVKMYAKPPGRSRGRTAMRET